MHKYIQNTTERGERKKDRMKERTNNGKCVNIFYSVFGNIFFFFFVRKLNILNYSYLVVL